MKWLVAVVAVFGAIFATQAKAEFYTGNKLHDLCTTSPPIALGYAVGISDDAELIDIDGKLYCVPVGVTAGQLKDVVCNYVRDNPASRHQSASMLARLAILKAWPCSRKGDRQ